jgi:hypothetical protein
LQALILDYAQMQIAYNQVSVACVLFGWRLFRRAAPSFVSVGSRCSKRHVCDRVRLYQRLEQQWQQLVPKLEALHGPEGAAEGAAAAAAVVQNGPLPTLERRMSGDRALPGLPAAPLGGPPAPSRDSASAPLPPPPADGDDSEDVVGV